MLALWEQLSSSRVPVDQHWPSGHKVWLFSFTHGRKWSRLLSVCTGTGYPFLHSAEDCLPNCWCSLKLLRTNTLFWGYFPWAERYRSLSTTQLGGTCGISKFRGWHLLSSTCEPIQTPVKGRLSSLKLSNSVWIKKGDKENKIDAAKSWKSWLCPYSIREKERRGWLCKKLKVIKCRLKISGSA